MKIDPDITLREHLSRAGKASAAKLTPEQRSARAKKAAAAREAKRLARPTVLDHTDDHQNCSACGKRMCFYNREMDCWICYTVGICIVCFMAREQTTNRI